MLFTIDADARLNRQVLAARDDEREFERLVRQNKRFILGCAYRTAHRFISESDDEWSIALMGFHEAAQTYDEGRGSFKSFAALVIRRRLMDYFDGESRRKNELATDFAEPLSEEDAAPLQLEVQHRLSRQAMDEAARESAVRDEIEAAQQLLAGYGFSFFDLTDCSPKAQKTKAACAAAVRALLADPALMEHLRRTRTLPIKALCRTAGVTRKLLDAHRRYIIAAAELLYGDFPHITEYLSFIRKGGTP